MPLYSYSPESIPKIIHYIWFSSTPRIEDFNLYYIIESKKNNPSFSVKLWTSYKTLNSETKTYLQSIHNVGNIEIIDLDDEKNYAELANIDIIHYLLHQGIEKRKIYSQYDQSIRCWLCASDLLRIAILYKHGGYYLDGRFYAKPGLDMIPASKGFLLHEPNVPLKTIDPKRFAAIPKHPLLLRMLKSLRLRFLVAFTLPTDNDFCYKTSIFDRNDLDLGEQHYSAITLTGTLCEEIFTDVPNFNHASLEGIESITFPKEATFLTKESNNISTGCKRDFYAALNSIAFQYRNKEQQEKKYLMDENINLDFLKLPQYITLMPSV